MAREDRSLDQTTGAADNLYEGAGVDLSAPTTEPTAPTAPGPETTPAVGGSEPPPSSAGDELPDRSFPVPPVPPPPSAGPIFTLAGGGGGGAASFARPGTAAAKPFRSQLFATNRTTAAGGPPQARFGAGTAVAAGGSFLPTGLGGEAGAPGVGGPDEELRRIMAAIRGGGGRG